MSLNNYYQLHICSLNCQGLGQYDKINRVNVWMKQQKCQILFIQETHFVKEHINKINQNCDADYFHSFGNSNWRGVSILISKQVEYSIIDTHQDLEGRMLILNSVFTANFDRGDFRIIDGEKIRPRVRMPPIEFSVKPW